ncbi:MAG: hypothetical protein NZ841_01020 [Dictyoglomus sp.]|nr:hypothetical protein [Dictyoglomus sp.]MCX7942294.1 hypothetical protein [Dictyoglomaceae bacterium]MDW8187870.1 hypothetical protein [Dictyoglomus sp.]
MKKLLVILFLLSISLANTNLVIYSKNFALISLEKIVELKQGINYVPLDEIPGDISLSSVYITSQKGSIIKEIIYPNWALWIISEKSINETLNIFYFLPNISWSCEHFILVDEKSILNFNSRIIVQNNSNNNFKNIKLSLLAGEPQVIESVPTRTFLKAEIAEGVSPEEIIESKGEYKIFSYKEPVSILAKQHKLLPWLDNKNVIAEKIYFYDYQRDINGVFIEWRFENSRDKGLGVPIPSGKIRIFLKDKDRIVFLGESILKDIAEGEKFTVLQGKAFDIKGERKILESKEYTEAKNIIRERKIQVIIRNSKEEKVKVEVKEYLEGDWQVISSSLPFEKIDANNIKFILDVSPKKEAILVYSYRTRLPR